jgi:tetratricopeptide (TPR) repeat protein
MFRGELGSPCGAVSDVYSQEPLQAIRVSADGFEFIDRGTKRAGFWGDQQGPSYQEFRKFSFGEIGDVDVKKCNRRFSIVRARDHHYVLNGLTFWIDQKDAQLFAEAVNRLAFEARGGNATKQAADFADFQTRAKVWRTLAAKPDLPEAAKRHKVLAENAVEEKDWDKAIDEYEEALTIDPYWPEGQFNAALLCGETGSFSDAITHMKYYLELVPDAPDAEAARNRIIIWRDKLGH